MARQGRLALPGDDLAWTADVSMTNEDATYPAANLVDADPATVAKSTTTSTVITIDCNAVVTPVGIAVINTNATSATLANGAGLNQAITIPALDSDGQRRHGWRDLTGVANAADDVFTLTLSRPSGVVWAGRIALVVTWRTINWQYGLRFGVLRPGNTVLTTRLGSRLKQDAGLRTRWVETTLNLDEDAPIYRALEQSAKGPILPFLLIPDVDVNDAWWVDWPEAFSERQAAPGFTEIPVRFDELCGGPPNG